MKITDVVLWNVAFKAFGKAFESSNGVYSDRRFRGHFGVTAVVGAEAWNMMERDLVPNATVKHFLWALFFLKCYNIEHVNTSLTETDEKTFRQWVWYFVDHLSRLRLIIWSNRAQGYPSVFTRVSVDGTDFRIPEQFPFDKRWYSYKFNGPALRCEICVCVRSGLMVWIHGPFPCGSYPDLRIFRLKLKQALDVNEKVIADRGYRDESCVNPYSEAISLKSIHSTIRARHETLNRRLKQFNILHNVYRHGLAKHSTVVFAVANLTQLMLQSTDSLFTLH